MQGDLSHASRLPLKRAAQFIDNESADSGKEYNHVENNVYDRDGNVPGLIDDEEVDPETNQGHRALNAYIQSDDPFIVGVDGRKYQTNAEYDDESATENGSENEDEDVVPSGRAPAVDIELSDQPANSATAAEEASTSQPPPPISSAEETSTQPPPHVNLTQEFSDRYGLLKANIDTEPCETIDIWFRGAYHENTDSQLQFFYDKCQWYKIVPQYIAYAMRRHPKLITNEPGDFMTNLAKLLVKKQNLYTDIRVQSLFDASSDEECLDIMIRCSSSYFEEERYMDDEVSDRGVYQRVAESVSGTWEEWIRSPPEEYNYEQEGLSFLKLKVPFGAPYQFIVKKIYHHAALKDDFSTKLVQWIETQKINTLRLRLRKN